MGVIDSHNNYLLITYYVLGRVNKMEQMPVTRHFQIEFRAEQEGCREVSLDWWSGD